MRAPAALALLTLLAAAALTGCLGADVESVSAVAYQPLASLEPGGVAHYAIFVNNSGTFREDLPVRATSLPPEWRLVVEPDTTARPGAAPEQAEGAGDVARVYGENTTAVIVAVQASPNATYGLHRVRVGVGPATVELLAHVVDLNQTRAREGVGVQVSSVGFWDNGTVFWTNMKQVRDNARLASAADPGDAMEPLKVYVGGERGETPPEPYGSRGYVPVIEGYDERLRGMRAGDTLAVRMPPEKAYTYAGNEDHFLYGDALNFLVTVVSVDVLEEDALLPVPPAAASPAGAPAASLR